jgi:hypothetical protein
MHPLAQVVDLVADIVALALKRLEMPKLLLDFGEFVAGVESCLLPLRVARRVSTIDSKSWAPVRTAPMSADFMGCIFAVAIVILVKSG